MGCDRNGRYSTSINNLPKRLRLGADASLRQLTDWALMRSLCQLTGIAEKRDSV